jgi:hypothetical protein
MDRERIAKRDFAQIVTDATVGRRLSGYERDHSNSHASVTLFPNGNYTGLR